MDRKVAFFVDGGYFIRRIKYFHRKYYPAQLLPSSIVLHILNQLVELHQHHFDRHELYRVYYYDAPPPDKQIREPVPREGHTGLATRNFKKEDDYQFQTDLHTQLRKTRKTALRMGELSGGKDWLLKDEILSKLLSKELTVENLQPEHFRLNIRQKGVDTRIGVDVASLTLNKLVDTIVLFAGDADFVPVAKMARTHGVDVILDPLHSTQVSKSLIHHIDGRKSFDIVSYLKESYGGIEPDTKPPWWQN